MIWHSLHLFLAFVVALSTSSALSPKNSKSSGNANLFSESLKSGRDRRDVYDNIALDDPASQCRNGGVPMNGRCHCIYPHTGETCEDFNCVHGLSVGKRFDPRSLFFNRPCICQKGWTGDLCEFHLSDKCNNRGEWKGSHCECIGFFFGPTCQFTSRCVMGKTLNGRCICNEDWEGDYCHRIICHHGFADMKNRSMSCICSKRYTGRHCDACAPVPGSHVSAYPECKVVKKPVIHKTPRVVATHTNSHRVTILVCSGVAFFLVIALMVYLSLKYRRIRQERFREQQLEMAERRQILEGEVARQPEELPSSLPPKSPRRNRRRSSLQNLFKWRSARSASVPAAPAGIELIKGRTQTTD